MKTQAQPLQTAEDKTPTLPGIEVKVSKQTRNKPISSFSLSKHINREIELYRAFRKISKTNILEKALSNFFKIDSEFQSFKQKINS